VKKKSFGRGNNELQSNLLKKKKSKKKRPERKKPSDLRQKKVTLGKNKKPLQPSGGGGRD